MIRLIFAFACTLAASAFCCAQQTTLPSDCKVTGSTLHSQDGFISVKEGKGNSVRLDGPIVKEGLSLVVKGRTGKGDPGIVIDLINASGEKTYLLLRAMDAKIRDAVYPNAYIGLGGKGGWARYYVRPNPAFYKDEELASRMKDWGERRGASEHSFCVEIRLAQGNESEVWMDGQFMRTLPVSRPESYRITLLSGAVLESLEFKEGESSDRRPLPVAMHYRDGNMINADLRFDSSAAVAEIYGELVGKDMKGIAVGGLGVFTGLVSRDLQSYFWRRHASHCLPEQRMFSVPLATYSHAHILCAMEESSGESNGFTFRVTRYGGSRGNAMADTLVKVPKVEDAALTDGAHRVGTVTYGPEGQRKTAALWSLKVPIRIGMIQDLIYDDTYHDENLRTSRYLDVELLDPLEKVEESYAFPPTMKKVGRAWQPTPNDISRYDYRWPERVKSGVTVFGITLEKSPAGLKVGSNLGHQAFYASDKPEFIATVDAEKGGDYTLHWEFADVEGRIVESGREALELPAGSEKNWALPVKQGTGWYACRFRLSERTAGELIDYRTSFVMLPPDTRKAGFESPFYGWWFKKNQRSDVKLEEVGPLLQRLGIRRAGLSPDMPEHLSKKFGFTEAAVDWTGMGSGRRSLRDFRDGKKTLAEAIESHEAYIREAVKLWPNVDRMLVFHEDTPAGAPFPSEMWGEPAPDFKDIEDENSPEALLRKEGQATTAGKEDARATWEANWPKRMEYLTAMAKMVREKFPQLKMMYGNDGNSLGTMGELFRKKFPKEWIDTISIEDLGQSFAPERTLLGSLHSAWFLRETARKMGYGDVPITACTEWIGRMTERLGLETQAEWKVRDGLLALAYGFDTISIGGINDASSGYYYSIWANGGLTTRYPTMAPKPAYLAVATLTQVLDRAKFQRFVPTESSVLYVQEFERNGEWIYAIWTPRGERETALNFARAENYTLTDLYGRERTITGQSIAVTAKTAPQYLISKNRLQSVASGRSVFTEDQAPESLRTVIPTESLDAISISAQKRDEEWSIQRPWIIPQKREGIFEIREVEDPEMGKCVELELVPQGELWEMTHEYVYLKLKRSVRTKAKNAGIWIKGNGSWGQVDIWKNRPWGPWLSNANNQMNWPGEATMNFEGWHFIQYPYYDWLRDSDTEVLGITLTMPRSVLYGTEMVPVANLKIRIKSIVLF